jgi:hypothetical protein
MTVIAKKFRKYVFLGNLGLSPRKVHSSPRKMPFSTRNVSPSSKKIHYS